MSDALAAARSFLYVPGDRPDLVDKALQTDADAVIIDTEDGVVPSARRPAFDAAIAVVHAHGAGRPLLCVRLDHSLVLHVTDLLGGRLAGLVLPGVEGTDLLRHVADQFTETSAPLIPLVESAPGLRHLDEICAHPNVLRLGMGEADLRADLGIEPGDDDLELLPHRAAVVAASAAAGLAAPIGSTSTDFRDLERLRVTSDRLRRLGFRGRTAIHPAQLAVVNQVFAPSDEQLAHARAVLDAFEQLQRDGRGAGIAADGTMIDEAVVRSARDTLRRAGTAADGSGDHAP